MFEGEEDQENEQEGSESEESSEQMDERPAPNLEFAEAAYKRIADRLALNNTVVFTDAAESMECALKFHSEPVTHEFLKSHMNTVVNVQLIQRPGHNHLVYSERTLRAALDILFLLPTEKFFEQLNTVAEIVCPEMSLYGGGTHRTFFEDMITKFTNKMGFQLLANAPSTKESAGRSLLSVYGTPANFTKLLKGLNCLGSCYLELGADARSNFITKMMSAVMDFPEELLKKDKTVKDLEILVVTLKKSLCGRNEELGIFYNFWMDLTLKLLKSGTVVLRIFGLEQLKVMITTAEKSLPIPSEYEVKGAGMVEVNGIYSVHEINHRVKFNFGEDKHQHWSYCLRKANNDAGEDKQQQQQPDFLMLVNERIWWICLPFEKRPKNRADESACDFYMNDCKQDVHLAPKRGWITCKGGKTPPPEVVPHSYSFHNGNYEDTLKCKLLRWCSEQNLVDQLFGASIHRAIVSSSTPLLQFLIESRALTLLDVNVMWKSVLSCDADTADEITDILVEVSVEFDRELFGQFMDICRSSLVNEQKDALQGLIYKVATFVEKYEADKVPNANILKLLDLFWAVFSHPNFPDYKNSLGYYETFSSFLNRNDGVDFVKGRIDDCVNALSALRHAQHTVDEKLASKTLSTLKFLLSLETFRKSVETFDQFDLPNVVIHEVGRFVAANRETPVQQHGTASTLPPLLDFLGEVSLRLNQLRLYYGASPEVNISITQLDNLWHLFKDDYRCLGCFFDLLSAQPLKPSSGKDGVVSILEEGELEHVFERYVCSADLDWSKCCPKVFFCFAAFFDTLGIPHLVDANSSMSLRGMSTLWSIFTNVGDAYSKNGAVALILKACPRKDDLMKMVFEILGKHRGVMGGSNNHLSATGCDVIVRCVELLSSAIFQGKSPSSPSSCSHAARGLFGRVQLLIACKKIGGVTRVKAQPQDETVKISIHPTSTILHLKKAIAQEINVDPSNISFPSWDKTWTDATSLTWVPGVVDDASISCSVLNKVNYPNTAQVSRDASPHEETNSLTIGEELANNSEYFTTLLAFCDDISDPVLAKKVWDLVMLIPTNLQFEEQVRQASHWAELLENNTSSASVAYSLQIIDHILQPGQDYKIEHSLHTSSEFQKTFDSAGGGLHILRILTTFSPSQGLTRKVALSVALRILRFFLSSSSSAAEADMEVVDQDVATPVFAELQKNAVLLVEKLLLMASAAASEHETEIVKDALTTISELIRDPAAASKLVEIPESRNLLISLLRSRVIKVRKEASTFAAHLGKIEPIVFAWLLDELQPEKPSVFVEIFDALDDLLCEFCTRGENLQIDLALLSKLISDKMVSIARLNDRSDMKSVELVGHLKLLLTLVTHKPLFIQDTPLGKDFVKTILNDFLYTLPGHEEIRDPACAVKSQRRLALKILGAYLAVSSESFEQMLASLHHLTDAAEKRALRVSPFSGSYGGSDDKKTNVRFTGLKNQGCTCYMNSTLQQLYMNKTFREALLAVPLKETQRSTILHRSDEELVGMELLICAVTSVTQYSWKYKEPKEEAWNRIHVLSYSNQTGRHMVQFIEENQTQEMILRSQSYKLRRAPVPGDEETSSAQEKAIQVFEQLQRTFYHMQFSKRKYFDPLPLVAACASLDLNYNVFQQNDAAEFFDKLIERVEMVTKVVRPGEEVAAWEKVFERHIFGGRTTYRKVPLSCEKYAEDKQSCGQTQAATTDPVFKFEVQVRSKDNMYDSLNEGFVAETLDGDNKIQCDVCNEKKGAIRQPIISVLPNMLVFHLKRFDMDYTTFETVKLNNLLEFPQRINMLKYTMAGVDAEDRRKAREAEKAAEGSTSPSRRRSLSVHTRDDADDSDPDPADYEYELQGVLIHAGVAGGGHYFSFARDPDNQDKWFRLDDDDVTSFTMTPEQLALNCFGGAWEKGNGRVETRTSNALMVFYSKVNPSTNDVKASVPVESTATAVQVLATDAGDGMDICNGAPSIDVPYVTGYEAFRKEVFDSNNEHTLKKYVNEEILHEFILSAIERANVNSNPSGSTTAFPWAASSTQSDLLLRAIEFGLKFFLKVAIHSQWSLKSRWLECFRSAFETCPSAALTFLGEISRENNNGLDYYFSDKASFTARAALVSLVTSAAKVASPSPDCQMLQLESESEDGGVLDPTVATCLQLVRSVRKCIFSLWTQSRFTINDPIVLLTRLSAIPALRQAFLSLKTVSQLSVLLDEDTAQRAKPETLNMYLADGERLTKRKNDESFSADVHNIYVQTLECIAALLGRPAQPRLPLLEDASDSAPKERSFTAAAAHAFEAIFKEYWSRGMNEQVFEEDVLKGAFPAFQNYVQIRALFQRNAGDRNLISAQGFVQACQELVNLYGEEKPWVWLQKHGVLSDLSLATSPRSAAARIDPPGATLVVPAECVASLLHAGYYSDAFEVEAWADVAKSILDKLFCIMPQAPNVMTRDIGRMLDEQNLDDFFPLLKFCLLRPEKTQELLRLLFVREEEANHDYCVLDRCLERDDFTKLGRSLCYGLYCRSTVIRKALYLILQSKKDENLKIFLNWCNDILLDERAQVKARSYNVVVNSASPFQFLVGIYRWISTGKGGKYVSSREGNESFVLLRRPDQDSREQDAHLWFFCRDVGQKLHRLCKARNSSASPGNTESCVYLPPQGSQDWSSYDDENVELSLSFVPRDSSSSQDDTEDEDD